MVRILTVFILLCTTMTPPVNAEEGNFGFRHGELHEHGVIQKLMRKTRSDCCEGEHSGECRVTIIKFTPRGPMAKLDGVMCPIPPSIKIHYDIQLPDGAFAVVCADKRIYRENGCPDVYCAAASPGT